MDDRERGRLDHLDRMIPARGGAAFGCPACDLPAHDLPSCDLPALQTFAAGPLK